MESKSENCNDRVIESKELLGKCAYICILHEGEIYMLRITKSNKLILTK